MSLTLSPKEDSLATREIPPSFFRAGGFYQLLLKSAEDLDYLSKLDQSLWVASSCPTRGLDLEPATLDCIDSDGDGRIRVPEILATLDWLKRVLHDRSRLPLGEDGVETAMLNAESPEGAELLRTIARIHDNLGLTGQSRISLAQTLDRSGIFAAVKSNGDGVIPASAADSEAVSALIADILKTIGGVQDRGGQDGVTAEGVKQFYTALDGYLRWWVEGHPDDAPLLPPAAKVAEVTAPLEDRAILPGQLESAIQKEAQAREKVTPDEARPRPRESKALNPDIFVFGERTPGALAALNGVREKIDDYFEQAELAAFDAQSLAFLNFNDADLKQLAGRRRDEVLEMLESVPLARVRPDAVLPLKGKEVNPAFAERLEKFNREVVAVVFNEEKACLTAVEWQTVTAYLHPYEAWLQAKAGSEVESLGVERIGYLLNHPEHREALDALIAVDTALAAEIAAVNQVERLLRLHRDFFRLLNNYVALPEFYDRGSRAIFQMGTLIIDGCQLNLCIEVLDAKAHAAIAANSGIFLIYCLCRRSSETRELTICAAVTSRNAGRITVGKNAVFYDREGKDWDARVVQVVDNPISLAESAWAPFKKIGEIVTTQIQKLTAARQAEFEKSVSANLTNMDRSLHEKTAAHAAAPAPSGGNIGGLMAGGGVAIAAISSSIAYLAQTLSKIHDIYILYTIMVIAFFIIGPSMLLGFLRLRARDIGMILEAGGWAINGKMRINLRLASELTQVGQLPPGSIRIDHAYVDHRARRRRRLFWLCFALFTACVLGFVWWVKAGMPVLTQ